MWAQIPIRTRSDFISCNLALFSSFKSFYYFKYIPFPLYSMVFNRLANNCKLLSCHPLLLILTTKSNSTTTVTISFQGSRNTLAVGRKSPLVKKFARDGSWVPLGARIQPALLHYYSWWPGLTVCVRFW